MRGFVVALLMSTLGLSSCNWTPPPREPFPIQAGVCDFFETTEHMREYWIGIHDVHEVPDVKVQIPSEYMDFRLKRFEIAGRLDGAIGFGIRPLDFAPSQGYVGVQEYPDGPIDPSKHRYKDANGGLVLTNPSRPDANARMFAFDISLPHAEAIAIEDFIANSVPSEEADGLLIPLGQKKYPRRREILIHANDGDVTRYFSCSKRELEQPGQPYGASCIMYTNIGPVYVSFRFDRDFLPEWRDLSAKVEEFVGCMILEVEDEAYP